MDYIALLAGLGLLFVGGEAMLRGAVGVARRYHLSDVFVGVAVVGFGTSAPEMFVSVDAALSHQPNIALGNVIGSNTANLLLILGTGALIRTIRTRARDVRNDALMMTLGMALLAAIVIGGELSRLIGGALLLGMAWYMTASFRIARRKPENLDPALAEFTAPRMRMPILIGLIVGGLVGLAAGSELLIYGAVNIAEAIGVSDRVIGVSIVAVGTSLPELATTIVAARRGQSDVAIGNILGSCVFNVFAILGVTAIVAPFAIATSAFMIDIAVMGLASCVALGLALTAIPIGRLAGIVLLTMYAAYMAFLFLGPPA